MLTLGSLDTEKYFILVGVLYIGCTSSAVYNLLYITCPHILKCRFPVFCVWSCLLILLLMFCMQYEDTIIMFLTKEVFLKDFCG